VRWTTFRFLSRKGSGFESLSGHCLRSKELRQFWTGFCVRGISFIIANTRLTLDQKPDSLSRTKASESGPGLSLIPKSRAIVKSRGSGQLEKGGVVGVECGLFNGPVNFSEYVTRRGEKDSAVVLPSVAARDQLKHVLRRGAQRMLAEAVERFAEAWRRAASPLQQRVAANSCGIDQAKKSSPRTFTEVPVG